MPPLRSDRASRACENCRRLKTRCYPTKSGAAKCLRCETQNLECSLRRTSKRDGRASLHVEETDSEDVAARSSVPVIDERLAKLEAVVHKIVDRLDTLTRTTTSSELREEGAAQTRSPPSSDERDAPVLLIKDIAENNHVGHYDSSDVASDELDPVENGTVRLEDAYELLNLFRLHYSRWVNFDDEVSLEELMARVRASPLLLYSICLVAARHTNRRDVNELAPAFFREAKRLLQSSLLTTPQSLEFFQAALILSLWSTTVGQVPLSIDSWLLTSYALQQGWASSMATGTKGSSFDSQRLRVCCTWNHLCLAHLQYCVGTGRRSLLQETQIERCADILAFEVSQFEVRMVAELKLYWIMVSRCCASTINFSAIRTALQTWRKEWSFLFDQPRSQFLEMGYNFAILLAYCRSIHSQASRFNRARLNEMVQRARDIIILAKSHTDERTPHLTDHIYHIITFSAITLCRLITKYSNVLEKTDATTALQDVITGLIAWLRSIGPAFHIGRILANIIAIHYKDCMAQKSLVSLQPHDRNTTADSVMPRPLISEPPVVADSQVNPHSAAWDHSFQDLAWTTFFDFNADDVSWPESGELTGGDYTPVEESWTTSAYAASP